MNEELLKAIKERGLLLEKEIFDLVSSIPNASLAKEVLISLEKFSGQKIITKSVLNKNIEYVQKVINNFPGKDKSLVENIFVKFGLSFEIRKESGAVDVAKVEEISLKVGEKKQKTDYQIFYSTIKNDKKLNVEDFVGNFRSRYQMLQKILMGRPELQNLTSINKISSGDRQNISIIGIVSGKRITKNKNLIIRFEDLTGEINALVKFDNEEIFRKAEELLLDDVVGIRASGNREILFIYDVIFPDAYVPEKVRFDSNISLAFLSDVHVGGARHLEKSFNNFLNWINSEDENAKKIKYLFFLGDNVDGVGVFPGQEPLLKLKSLKEQYDRLAENLRRIPKDIIMFMCPGQHDASRVAQPQPIISQKYAGALYEIENLVLVSNPAMIKLVDGAKEFKVLMYHGDSIHTFIHEIRELREIKAARTPAKVIMHMLKRRHLDPFHSEAVYIPSKEKDTLVITEVPDLFCTGEMHRVDVENYNGILIITGSCWQGQTAHEEKLGSVPDPCKVPILNLKTRELKVLDFGMEEELKELHVR